MVILNIKYSFGLFLILFFNNECSLSSNKNEEFIENYKKYIQDGRFYNFESFAILFLKNKFLVSTDKNYKKCIEDKNGDSYLTFEFNENTTEKEKKDFIKIFSVDNIDKNVIKNNFIEDEGLVFGRGISLVQRVFLNYLFKSEDKFKFIIIGNKFKAGDKGENFYYIAGGISFRKIYKDNNNNISLDLKINLIKNKENIKEKEINSLLEIESIAISKELRKNGLGSALLQKLNDNNKEMIKFLVYDSSDDLKKFYKKNGYSNVEEYKKFNILSLCYKFN
jgi:ribosomal protein S18 acetylase RimI-like enzyme